MPSDFEKRMIDLSWDFTGVSQVISGIMLVYGVLSIRSFFKKRNAEDFINTGMLLRHAGAFGLYMLSAGMYYGTHTIYSFNPNTVTWNIFLLGGVFGFLGSLIAQLFLSVIFWDLGKKLDGPADLEEHATIEIEEFDEDADL